MGSRRNKQSEIAKGLGVLLCWAVLIAVGCGSSNWRGQVRHQASQDLRCPQHSIEIIRHRESEKGRRVTLDICGKVRVYRETRAMRKGREVHRWRMVKRRRRRGRRRPANPYAQAVRRIMSKAQPSFDACHHAAKRRQPALSGTVVVRFIIDNRGRVIEAIPEVNQLTPGVGSCLVNRIREQRFPTPPGGREALFHWPFVLEE